MSETSERLATTCRHASNHAAFVDVAVMDEGEGLGPEAFMVDIRVECADCGQPFVFIAPDLPVGLDFHRPTVSVSGETLNVPATPADGSLDPTLRAGLPGFSVVLRGPDNGSKLTPQEETDE